MEDMARKEDYSAIPHHPKGWCLLASNNKMNETKKLEEEEHELTHDELDYLRSQEDCCSECGARITENHYTTTEESRGEFWGAPTNEIIVTGYKCSECGNEEDF
jgi:hypothetical protein